MGNHSELKLTNEVQLEEVVAQYGRPLMNFAFTYLKDWLLSEDAVANSVH